MDHSEAESGHAVERYLLGEMPEAEAEGFEQHFFECRACTDGLAAGALLVENLRAVPRTVKAAAPGMGERLAAWWRRPLFAAPAFAALALATIVAYQARELARVDQAQPLLAYMVKSATRGEPNQIRIPAGTRFVAIDLDLADGSFPMYRCRLYGSSGRLYFSVDSAAPPAGLPLSILAPAAGLQPGTYTLRVQGLRGSQVAPEAAQYRIEITP